MKNINSATEIKKTFDYFSLFSGLKIKRAKYKISGICLLKRVKLTLCGMESVNLNNNAIKMLGICYSYDKNLRMKRTFSFIL